MHTFFIPILFYNKIILPPDILWENKIKILYKAERISCLFFGNFRFTKLKYLQSRVCTKIFSKNYFVTKMKTFFFVNIKIKKKLFFHAWLKTVETSLKFSMTQYLKKIAHLPGHLIDLCFILVLYLTHLRSGFIFF